MITLPRLLYSANQFSICLWSAIGMIKWKDRFKLQQGSRERGEKMVLYPCWSRNSQFTTNRNVSFQNNTGRSSGRTHIVLIFDVIGCAQSLTANTTFASDWHYARITNKNYLFKPAPTMCIAYLKFTNTLMSTNLRISKLRIPFWADELTVLICKKLVDLTYSRLKEREMQSTRFLRKWSGSYAIHCWNVLKIHLKYQSLI